MAPNEKRAATVKLLANVLERLRDWGVEKVGQTKLAHVGESEPTRDVSDRVEIPIVELFVHHGLLGPVRRYCSMVSNARNGASSSTGL